MEVGENSFFVYFFHLLEYLIPVVKSGIQNPKTWKTSTKTQIEKIHEVPENFACSAAESEYRTASDGEFSFISYEPTTLSFMYSLTTLTWNSVCVWGNIPYQCIGNWMRACRAPCAWRALSFSLSAHFPLFGPLYTHTTSWQIPCTFLQPSV